VKRYEAQRRRELSPSSLEIFERVAIAYINQNPLLHYSPNVISMIAVFADFLKEESDVFFCFQGFMNRFRLNPSFPLIDNEVKFCPQEMLQHRVASFNALFKIFLPELCEFNLHVSRPSNNLFEQEEIEPGEWVVSWFSSLLCRELSIFCVARIWDTYFASPDGMELHTFVCLGELCGCSLHSMSQLFCRGFKMSCLK
jgi:hypothetical protein